MTEENAEINREATLAATPQGALSPAPEPAPKKRRKLSRLSKWLLWIGSIVLFLVVAAGITVAILLHRAEPMIRAALIDNLQKRFNARVELDNLHVSILDGFWVQGSGLRIWLPQEPDASGQAAQYKQEHPEPWIAVGHMHFHVSWHIRPSEPIVIHVIHIDTVKIILPPKEDRPHLAMPGKSPQTSGQTQPTDTQPPQDQSKNGSLLKMPRIEIKRIECNDATLLIERKQEPNKVKPPLDFELRKITLFPDGKGGPIAFIVDMINARPVGIIHTTGHFGPWVTGNTGALPVSGDYKFEQADLGTIKGIEGILSSTGNYSGTLGHINAQGTTQTPDFRLERVKKGTGVMLTTSYQAIVDGTNGNTWLSKVDATLGHTHFICKGQVLRADDVYPSTNGEKLKGHDIQLDVTMDRGRIEDILQIAADSDQPFMTGSLALQTKFHLPPGKESVWDKLLLDGQFHLTQARFSNPSMQGKIEQLSLRGQGKPGDVKTTDPTTILSEMHGHFKLGNGTLQLPDLDYLVPGAEILAHGKYGLQAGTLDFEGDARLEATLSKVVGGWKGFLLKPADRFLRKNGAGLDVPIHVQGTRKDPKFGVDFDRLGKTEKTGPEERDDKTKPGAVKD